LLFSCRGGAGGGWGGGINVWHVGPTAGSLFGVGDLGDDGCRKTDTVLQNFDDQAEYSLSGYANGV
jgi:hypothetical protein